MKLIITITECDHGLFIWKVELADGLNRSLLKQHPIPKIRKSAELDANEWISQIQRAVVEQENVCRWD